MPWFKVDDGFHAHHKVAKLGPDHSDALSLWVVAGSWSADQLTDGWVPEYVAARLDVHYAERAKALVRVGLWGTAERDGEPGWLFHGWSDPGRNPTSEQVKAEREATAERQRRFRDRVKGTKRPAGDGSETASEMPNEAPESNAVTNAVSHGPVTAPVPFRSVPFLSMEEEELLTSATASPPADAKPKVASKQPKKAKAAPEPRPDVEALCNRLVELMAENGSDKPDINDAWRTHARLLLDKDQQDKGNREFDKAMRLLEWALKNHFWWKNIRSIPTFRKQYGRLRDDALDEWRRNRPLADQAPPGTSVELFAGGNVVAIRPNIPAPRLSTTDRAVAEALAANLEAQRIIYGSTG